MKSFVEFLNEHRVRYPATWVNRDTNEEITFNSEDEKKTYFDNLPYGSDNDWYLKITRDDDKTAEADENERIKDLNDQEIERQKQLKPKFHTPEEKRHYEEIWYN